MKRGLRGRLLPAGLPHAHPRIFNILAQGSKILGPGPGPRPLVVATGHSIHLDLLDFLALGILVPGPKIHLDMLVIVVWCLGNFDFLDCGIVAFDFSDRGVWTLEFC